MQGKLSEIDIRSILQLIELGQRTGELLVEAYPSATDNTGSPPSMTRQFWLVFFLNGQILYATDKSTQSSNLARLSDYLRRHKIAQPPSHVSGSAIAATLPEYDALWTLLEKHSLTPLQGRNIIQGMVQETLFDLLSLHQGTFVFELSPALAPQLTPLEISPLLAKTVQQVQEWKQFHPLVQSPDQCPAIAQPATLKDAISETTFNTLHRYVDAKTSIRQISRYLNRDIVTVARAIYPYVQQSIIQLIDGPVADPAVTSKPSRIKPLTHWQTARPPRIACIDDGLTVRETVTQMLQPQGYEISTLENPLTALSLVFQIKPDLILCDISMPELDGYQLCAMLRESTAFRQTPIVMLTGRDGFIDRVRARLAGATDYLTKPFGEAELLTLVEKYVNSSAFKQSQSLDQPLDQSLELWRPPEPIPS